MLSVCIPVYNFDVTPLVKKLVKQANLNSINLEIIIFDDGSEISYKEINKSIANLNEIKYKELTNNLGSAATRNSLVAEAKYNQILFLDSDSDIHSEFLKNYMPYLTCNNMIVYGGRVHPDILPSENKSLRWKVGKIKEDHDVKMRSKVPNKSFMSNNFLVKKELFNKISFDETIKKSGHEDTMFGIELEQKGIYIIHINNPVVHIGLENNDEFILKTKQRLVTLKHLTEYHKGNQLLKKRITILKYFNFIETYKLVNVINIVFKLTKNRIEKNLCTKNPSILLYDFYKLGYYSNLSKQNK